MLLLDILSFEIIQFLKIVMWVCVPLMVISMLVVTYYHYRNKRKAALNKTSVDLPSPILKVNKSKDEPLFKNYRHILNTPEKSTAISSEFKKGSTFYSSPNNGTDTMEHSELHEQVREKELEAQRLQSVIEQLQKELYLLDQQNKSSANEMQKLEQQVKELQEAARHAGTDARDVHLSFQQQMEDREKQFFDEKDRLTEQLRNFHEVQKKLEEENKELLEKLQQNRLQEDPSSRPPAPDINYLQDMLKEKNLQIEFLSNQLDQRIRTFHQAEQQVYDLQHSLNLQKEDLRQRLENEKELQQIIQQREESIQHLIQEVEQHKNLLDELHPQLEKSLEQVRFLENTIERKQSILSGLHQQLKLAIEDEESEKKVHEAYEEYP